MGSHRAVKHGRFVVWLAGAVVACAAPPARPTAMPIADATLAVAGELGATAFAGDATCNSPDAPSNLGGEIIDTAAEAQASVDVNCSGELEPSNHGIPHLRRTTPQGAILKGLHEVDFGQVPLGADVSATLTMSNHGDEEFRVLALEILGSGWRLVSKEHGVFGPGLHPLPKPIEIANFKPDWSFHLYLHATGKGWHQGAILFHVSEKCFSPVTLTLTAIVVP